MNAEMFEGIGLDRMHGILKSMEIAGTIGWAMEEGTKWGEHYYLISHRKAKPEIAANWMWSEYENGRKIVGSRHTPETIGGEGHEIPA